MAAVGSNHADWLAALRRAALGAAEVIAGVTASEDFAALSCALDVAKVLVTQFRDLVATDRVLNHHWLWAGEAVCHARFVAPMATG
jgi:hypothetical protein